VLSRPPRVSCRVSDVSLGWCESSEPGEVKVRHRVGGETFVDRIAIVSPRIGNGRGRDRKGIYLAHKAPLARVLLGGSLTRSQYGGRSGVNGHGA
jgi:hypothetical protein